MIDNPLLSNSATMNNALGDRGFGVKGSRVKINKEQRRRGTQPSPAEEAAGGEQFLEEVPLRSSEGDGANDPGAEHRTDFVEAEKDELGAGRASYGDDLDTLDRRRSEELKLIGEYDSAAINPRRECWFMINTKWLQSWAKFVRGEGPPPGRINNEALVQDDLKTPVDGLVSRVDYRGVNPTVWFLYVEMYGKDSAHDLCRYVIDIYEAEVPHKYRREIFEEPSRRAQVEVQKMRWRVEPDGDRHPERPRLCCCITENMIDCMFMSVFTCCAKCRRRCPWWLCCFCFCCCPRRTSASGGRYSRVINADADDDDDSALDDDIEYGVLEEEEDLIRSGKDKQGASVTPPSRNSGGTASGTRR